MAKLTEKTAMALGFLQENDGEYFGFQIAEALDLNPRGIHGVMNSLVRKEYVDKVERETEVEVEGKDGEVKTVTKKYKAYYLTQAGKDFDLNAEDAE